MNKLEVRKTLVELGIQASGSQIDKAIEALNLPTDLQSEHIDKLKGYFQATARPTTNGNGKPKMTSKTDLIKQLGITEPEFDARCQEWSVQIDREYSPGQVAWFQEHFAHQSNSAPTTQDENLGLMTQSGNKALVRNQKKLDRARQRGTDTAIAEVKAEFAAYAVTRLQAEDTLDQLMDDFDCQLDTARADLVPVVGKSPDFLGQTSAKFCFTQPSEQYCFSSAQQVHLLGRGSSNNGSRSTNGSNP